MIFGQIRQEDVHLRVSIVVPRDDTRDQGTVIPGETSGTILSEAAVGKDTSVLAPRQTVARQRSQRLSRDAATFPSRQLVTVTPVLGLFGLQENSGWGVLRFRESAIEGTAEGKVLALS